MQLNYWYIYKDQAKVKILWDCGIVLPGKQYLSYCCMRVEGGPNLSTNCVTVGGMLPNSFLLFLNYEVRQGRHVWTRVKLSLHTASYCPTGCQPIIDVRQVQRERLQMTFLSLCLKPGISVFFSNYRMHYFAAVCALNKSVHAMIGMLNLMFANENLIHASF